MQHYHDTEWSVPQRDSRMLWETLMLGGFQAGLSWEIILRKRETFRAAFAGFDSAKVARFGEQDIARLMGDPGIVRARAKIEARLGARRSSLPCKTKARTSPLIAGRSPMVSRSEATFSTYRRRYRLPSRDLWKARVQVRWPNHRLCVDAGGWHHQRPPCGRLLPLLGDRAARALIACPDRSQVSSTLIRVTMLLRIFHDPPTFT
jgi:hypothetical protein